MICERDRAYGRGLCLGIARATAREKDWSLEFVDDLSIVKSTRLAGFDGVIARVSDDDIAMDLKTTGLPVVDVYTSRSLAVLGVDNDELVCSFTSPTLSSIDNSAFRIGEAAVGLLSRMLRASKRPRNCFCFHRSPLRKYPVSPASPPRSISAVSSKTG